MVRRTTLVLVGVLVLAAAMPGVAVADDDDDRNAVYLSLGDSLAMGSLADASGTTVFPSNKSYTDRLFKKLQDRFDDDLRHVKLGCDGEKATDMIFGTETKCASDYVTGTQLGDAMMWLSDPTVDVVLVTIGIGANDINHIAGPEVCNFDPTCIVPQIPTILGHVGTIVGALRSTGYAGPIVGMNYYNPNVAASAGYFAGYPGPLAEDPAFAVLTDQLAQGFNDGLEHVYGTVFGLPVADVYSAFRSGDFADDGGRYQRRNNGVPDNADAVCRLTYMCPDEFGPTANIHPTPKGYKVMAKAFWKIVRRLDLGDDD